MPFKIYWVKAYDILKLTLLLNSSAFWITSVSVIEVDSSMLTNSIGSLKNGTQLLFVQKFMPLHIYVLTLF